MADEVEGDVDILELGEISAGAGAGDEGKTVATVALGESNAMAAALEAVAPGESCWLLLTMGLIGFLVTTIGVGLTAAPGFLLPNRMA